MTSTGQQIIGGTFSDRDHAEHAVMALEDMGISPVDIQVVVQLNPNAVKDIYTEILADRGFAETQARRFDQLIRQGKILVAVYDVTDPAPIIDILDEFEAEFNPDGSRNLREDVFGMTTGAMVGAAALGTVGAAVGGPAGAALGAAAGAVIGGGSGAAAGKAAEHRK